MPTAEYERQVGALLATLRLGEGTRTWLSCRYENEVLRVTLHAATSDASVVAAIDVDPPARLRPLLDELLLAHDRALMDELKKGVARTLVASLTQR